MNTPKIRFKGFTDDWEQRKLGDVFEQTTNFVDPNKKEIELWSLTVEDGLTPKSERYNREFLVKKDTGFKEVRSGDIVYNPMNMTLGAVGYNGMSKSVAVSGYYTTMITNEGYDSYYINTWLKSPQAMALYKTFATGSLIEKQRVQFPTLSIIPATFPQYEEQVRIGYYFMRLDHLITLHQRKCDETKQLKKFMLQKMFPKNGEKNPEIRFEGFTDDWEQRKFSDCYKMSSGYAFKMSDYCDEGVGLINGESIQHGIINDDNLNHLPEFFIQQYPEFLLKENDIVVGLNRPITNGNLKIARIPSKYNDSLLYQRAGKIVYKTDCDKDFTYVLLSQEILKHTLVEAVGSDQPFISTSKLDGWKMMMPSNMEEQVKIGEYFQNLDHLITLHQRKCEKLKELKKYMLQNMFV